MSWFNFKRRDLEVEEEEVRKFGDELLRNIRSHYPPGLRLKVTDKSILTDAGRAKLTIDDELVIGE